MGSSSGYINKTLEHILFHNILPKNHPKEWHIFYFCLWSGRGEWPGPHACGNREWGPQSSVTRILHFKTNMNVNIFVTYILTQYEYRIYSYQWQKYSYLNNGYSVPDIRIIHNIWWIFQTFCANKISLMSMGGQD